MYTQILPSIHFFFFLLWFYFTFCSCFNYSFIFPNIFFIFLILFSLYSLTLYCFLSFFLSFLFFSFLFFSFLFFFSAPRSLRDLGSQARGQAQAPVVGAPSPNRWINREPHTPGKINHSEASQRSSSQHQGPALSNCLQTPVLDASGQTTGKTGIQPQPSKKKKRQENTLQTKKQGMAKGHGA